MERNGNSSLRLIETGDPLEKGVFLPPWFNQDIAPVLLENAKKIEIEKIINELNYVHFLGDNVLISLKHPKYKDSILLSARPEPCLDPHITCLWQTDVLNMKLESCAFEWLLVNDGDSSILVPCEMTGINEQFISMRITDKGSLLEQREIKRFPGNHVGVELMQNGFVAKGILLDFNAKALRIRVEPDHSGSFNWFNPEDHSFVNLMDAGQTVMTCTCKVLRLRGTGRSREIVLVPDARSISRFPRREIKPERHQLNPSPKIIFEHPLSKRTVHRTVDDISYSGLAVHESVEEAVLLPGLIIPMLAIDFPGGLKLQCKAQVVSCREIDEKTVRCGIAFLDMDIPAYSRLTQLISKTQDPGNNISGDLDLDALWEFFFHTGFIYPKKYKLVKSYIDKFKTVYKKLYQDTPEIAVNYTYEKNGKILAHLSMLRIYGRAWMLHHHAARITSRRMGISILKLMVNYVNGIYRLPTPGMQYVMCYFRPDNHFPEMVYGKFAREHGDPRGCSLDPFAYLAFKLTAPEGLPGGWVVRESTPEDIREFDTFYRIASGGSSTEGGGLLIDAFGLREAGANRALIELYRKLGFERDIRLYSLLNGDEIKAVFIVNRADLGMNLSELLNSVKVVVLDQEGVDWETISAAVNQFAGLKSNIMSGYSICTGVQTRIFITWRTG
ncbi:MAG: type pilus assembly PilZ [Deltaproteobacteria bacterium]|nr:type pilus assembly PilZ [Deltaproteobacteria bacterium]